MSWATFNHWQLVVKETRKGCEPQLLMEGLVLLLSTDSFRYKVMPLGVDHVVCIPPLHIVAVLPQICH